MSERILSPASGKVLRIVEEERNRTITIFMHLHNLHVTSAPLDGVVKRITQEKGSFKPAFLTSADSNTKNTIELSTRYGDLNVVQIAGLFTRKILCEVKEGQEVKKGERIGKICFGSRVDITIPRGFEVLVEEGTRVKCGRTTIAVSQTGS
jgi:phosphatidylserine decarboxylase